jgi:isoquinoline 1-oxidoreductase
MGAIVQGIGGALFEAITFEDGRITNAHLADYRVPRFLDSPQFVEVVLIDRKDIASAGIAPAIGNAIFAATGSRLRNMPMAPSDPVPGIAPSPLTS